MKNIYGVTVLLNGDVYGVWTLEHKPSAEERTELRHVVAQATNKLTQFSVQFSDNLECDSFPELMSGIKESLYNDDYIDSKE